MIAVDNRVATEASQRLVDGLEAKGYDRQASKDRVRTMALRARARLKARGERAAAS